MEHKENWDSDSDKEVDCSEKSCVRSSTPLQENLLNNRNYEKNLNNENSQVGFYQRFFNRKRCSSELYPTQAEKRPMFESCASKNDGKLAYNKKVVKISSSYVDASKRNWNNTKRLYSSNFEKKCYFNQLVNLSITSSCLEVDENDWNDDDDSSLQTISMCSEENDSWNKESSPSLDNADFITVEDLNKAFLSRNTLERIVHMPFFKKTVLNCFVRINMGSGRSDSSYEYKPAQVIGVSRSNHIYSLGSTKSDRHLHVRLGNTINQFCLNMVSNSKFTQEEFTYWQENWKAHNIRLPTLKLLNEKCEHIEKAINHIYSNDDIDKILTEKHRLGIAPENILKKKVLLMYERHVAIIDNNKQNVEKLDRELAQLEETINAFRNKCATISRSKDPVPVNLPLQRKPVIMMNSTGTCPYELNNFDIDIDIQL